MPSSIVNKSQQIMDYKLKNEKQNLIAKVKAQVQAQAQEKDQPRCKICFGEDKPLISLCQCSGSIKYVHDECILQWICKKIEATQSFEVPYCQICHFYYSLELTQLESELSFSLLYEQVKSEKVSEIIILILYCIGGFFGSFFIFSFFLIVIMFKQNIWGQEYWQIAICIIGYLVLPIFILIKGFKKYNEKQYLIENSYMQVLQLCLLPTESIEE